MKFDIQKLREDEGNTHYYHQMGAKALAFHEELNKCFWLDGDVYEYFFEVNRDEIGANTRKRFLGSGNVVIQRDGDISLKIGGFPTSKKDEQYLHPVLDELCKKAFHFLDVAAKYGYLKFDSEEEDR